MKASQSVAVPMPSRENTRGSARMPSRVVGCEQGRRCGQGGDVRPGKQAQVDHVLA